MKKGYLTLLLGLLSTTAFGYGNEQLDAFKAACGTQQWAACQSARYDLYMYNKKEPLLVKWHLVDWRGKLGGKYHMVIRVPPMAKDMFSKEEKERNNLSDSKYRTDFAFFNEAEEKKFWGIVNFRLKEKFNNSKISYTNTKYDNQKANWMEIVMMAYLLQNDKSNSVAALNEIGKYATTKSEQKKYQKSYAWMVQYWQNTQ